jgi:hypothetical protein
MPTNDVGIRFRAQGLAEVQGALRLISRDLGNLQQNLGTSVGGLGVAGGNVSKTFVNASGEVTAFGKKAIQTSSAVAFSLSSLAAQGQVSFRSLATSATGFLAFFGPQGAIAAGVIATGLLVADFFSRTRKELRKTVEEGERLIKEGNERFRKAEPVFVAQRTVDARQAEVDRLEAEIAKKNVQIAKPGAGLAVAGLIGERTKLEKELADERYQKSMR